MEDKLQQKKRVLATLFMDGFQMLADQCPDAIEDAVWLMSDGVGDVEDAWDMFYAIFEEVFGISFEDAEHLLENGTI